MTLPTYGILVLGPPGSGKSWMVNSFVTKTYLRPPNNPAIGTAGHWSRVLQYPDKKLICMLDFAAAPSVRNYYGYMGRELLKRSDGIVICYDINNRESFNSVVRIWKEVNLGRWEKYQATGSNLLPMLLLGTKADNPDARAVSKKEGQDLARRLCMSWNECSALEAWGIEGSIQDLAYDAKVFDEQNSRRRQWTASNKSTRRQSKPTVSTQEENTGHVQSGKSSWKKYINKMKPNKDA